MNRKFCLRLMIAAAFLCSGFSYNYAASDKPIEMTADTIEYDANTGLMVAKGSVCIVQDKAMLTGPMVEYNSKTKEAHVTGGATAKQETATLIADEIRSYDNNHIIAQGGAVLTKDDKRLTGPVVEYFNDKQYAVVPSNAHLTSMDSDITANHLEVFLQEDRIIGDGAVHIVSDKQKLDAVSDHAVYYGAKSGVGQSKAILTGNARAIQDGNVLTGNELTIYPDDKGITAQGRTKLVIIPKD
ncbi:MAG: organic solvent tolerance protein OstA [Pelosinus sp.]|nr:organic solvent tolerance protein OstA [Pelosinus sp.]